MRVGLTETVLRDAPQSLIATRMRYQDFAEILPTLDQVGYFSLECWGGATFDACLRFLNEDPWQRLRNIRERCPNSKLQMLLRGQNLLGYRHYPDDVVRRFIQLAVGNGIDIIRIFDALNDLRNLQTAVTETVRQGADAQVAIAYTTSPVHTLENYVDLTRRIVEMGATSICVKDMAGVMTPRECEDLVAAIKEHTDLRLHVHAHATTGLAVMAYLKGVEAGADVIDTAISSFSGGTSQPATETMVFTLEQFGFDTGIDKAKLKDVNDFFRPLRRRYIDEGLLDPQVLETDVDSLSYQIPGGMLSNLISQLKSLGHLEKLDEVLEETPKVRADLGYPPLVTPTSQVVGAQATANVLGGKRYQMISSEVRSYLRGEYGQPPGPVDPQLRELALAGGEAITNRFADDLPDGLETAAEEAGQLAHSDEDVLSFAMFPDVYQRFAERRVGLPHPAQPHHAVPPSGNPGLAGVPDGSWVSFSITEHYDVDDATAALIMAIVAHQLGAAPSELTFHSIREK